MITIMTKNVNQSNIIHKDGSIFFFTLKGSLSLSLSVCLSLSLSLFLSLSLSLSFPSLPHTCLPQSANH